MSDDKTKADGEDRIRISLTEEYEVRDWAKNFGVTTEELTAAVKQVGYEASAIAAHVKSRKRS